MAMLLAAVGEQNGSLDPAERRTSAKAVGILMAGFRRLALEELVAKKIGGQDFGPKRGGGSRRQSSFPLVCPFLPHSSPSLPSTLASDSPAGLCIRWCSSASPYADCLLSLQVCLHTCSRLNGLLSRSRASDLSCVRGSLHVGLVGGVTSLVLGSDGAHVHPVLLVRRSYSTSSL